MSIALSFHGAARNVTGSRYLIETSTSKVLVDCGLYQERDLRNRNWEPFAVPPKTLDAVVLTHGHLDHCGLLPKLVREGFAGQIYCTPATADISRIVLLDSARIQEEDAEFKKRRHQREGRMGPRPEAALYTPEDAERAIPRLSAAPYEQPVPIAPGIDATFHEAGHILGATAVSLRVTDGSVSRQILFSGDIGRWDTPIVRDPAVVAEADYVVVESTYGDRLHKPSDQIPERLARIINNAADAGGNIVVPSFAIERTQELVYHLNELRHDKRIPHLRVFVDSPMAVRVTEVFRRHPELFDEEARQLLEEGRHPCDFPGLTMCRSVYESKSINHIRGTAIIVAGSGMCTGGRIKHHLAHNISRRESTIMFIGYQARGTLGRILLEGTPDVRIHGRTQPVRATITKINGFSAHGDRDELLRWLSGIKSGPRHVFVTHGEPESASSFAAFVAEQRGWDTSVPAHGDRAVLD